MRITEENGPVLREMLQKNSALKVMNLYWNSEVSDTGAIFIAEGLKQNSSLRELILGSCNIGDEGVESLGEALVENGSLKELGLWHNHRTSEQGLSLLATCLKANSGLVKLVISDYDYLINRIGSIL